MRGSHVACWWEPGDQSRAISCSSLGKRRYDQARGFQAGGIRKIGLITAPDLESSSACSI